MNAQIIITTPADRRLPCLLDAALHHQQADEQDPLFIVVRQDASDAQIERAAARFGVQAMELKMARAKAAIERVEAGEA